MTIGCCNCGNNHENEGGECPFCGHDPIDNFEKELFNLDFLSVSELEGEVTKEGKVYYINGEKLTGRIKLLEKNKSLGIYSKEGNIINGFKEGEWKYYGKNEELVEIHNFVKGNSEGEFIYYDKNGDIKEKGKFKVYIEDGKEISYVEGKNSYYNNGVLYREKTVTGKKQNGEDIVYYENGKIFEKTNYVNGNREGEYLKNYENGNIELIGNYQQDKKHGKWIKYSLNNEELGGCDNFINGNGYWKIYYVNGQVEEEGQYTDGYKTGEWISYYDNGKINEIGNFKFSNSIGEWKGNYKNGQIKYNGQFIIKKDLYETWYLGKNDWGSKDGRWIYFFEDGKISCEEDYKSGKRHGEMIFYNKDGSIKEKNIYIEDRLEKNKVKETIYNKQIKQKDELGSIIIKIYNDSNQIIEEKDYGRFLYYLRFIFPPFYKTIYIYGVNKKLVNTKYYRFNKLGSTTTHHYNDEGLLIKDTGVNTEGENSYTKYTYNEDGHCIGTSSMLPSGHKYGYSWEVDDEGNKIESTQIHYSG